MARVQDLTIKVEGDVSAFEKAARKAMKYYSYDPLLYCGTASQVWWISPSSSQIYEIEKQFKKGEPVKSLYKVFVVVNQETVFEKNVVSDNVEKVKFDAVREFASDVEYDDLDVYALKLCDLKHRKDCCC